MAQPLTVEELLQKLQPWLPPGKTWPEEGKAACQQALVHSTASEINMDAPAAYGDIHALSCLATVFEEMYPNKRVPGEIVEPLNMAAQNSVFAHNFRHNLGIQDCNIVVAADYPYAEKGRSEHRMGTAMEALIQAVKKYLGYDACVYLVKRLITAYLQEQGVAFEHLKKANPIGDLTELLAKNLGSGNHINYALEKLSTGRWAGHASIEGAPQTIKKGPVEGANKRECERELCRQVLSDSAVVASIESASKKRKLDAAGSAEGTEASER